MIHNISLRVVVFLSFFILLFSLNNPFVLCKEIQLRTATIDTEQEPSLTQQQYYEHKQHVYYSFKASEKQLVSSREKSLSQIETEFSEAVTFLSRPSNPVILLHFENLEDRENLANSLNIALERFGYIDPYTWVTRVPTHLLDKINQHPQVKWVGHLKPEHKTNLNLVNVPRKESSGKPQRSLKYVVDLMESSLSELEQTRQHLQQYISSLYGEVANFTLVSPKKLEVEVLPTHRGDVLSLVQHQESVSWISLKPEFRLSNRNANFIVQDGIQNANDGLTKFWDAGITGKGQIVGCADTGIDYDNCFFDDSSTPLPKNKIDKNHRKIVSYNNVEISGSTTDFEDDVAGHGTHVSGSIIGSIPQDHSNYQDLNMWNGVAHEAKIAFTDIGPAQGGLLVPSDPTILFDNAKNADGHIQSNSWGCSLAAYVTCQYDCQCKWATDAFGHDVGSTATDNQCQQEFGVDRCCEICNTYSTFSRDVDAFLFDNTDDAILFAAGNDGGISRSASIGFPATAKNVITVGASNTGRNNFEEAYQYRDYLHNIKSIRTIQRQGIQNTDDCCEFSSSDQSFQDAIHAACCPSYVRDTQYSDTDRFNSDVVAMFSSRGPATAEELSKPDIVSAGNIVVSMHSDGDPSTHQCGIESPAHDNSAAVFAISGTSMATPVTAGAAALIRQYFTDGYYPTGNPSTGNKIENPSGMLIKAALVHAGQSISKHVRGDGTLQNVNGQPSNEAGMGVVDLSKVLPLGTGSNDAPFNIYVHNLGKIGPNNDHTFTFEASSSGDVRATMVFYDPPAANPSSTVTVNRVSLTIESESKDNTIKSVTQAKDPVQHMETSFNQGDTYVVRVSAPDLKLSPQPYALIVTGSFSNPDVDAPDTSVSFSPSGDGTSTASKLRNVMGVFSLALVLSMNLLFAQLI